MSNTYRLICFYNRFGNGDLFISREFIKEVMERYPEIEYHYAHAKSSRMFEDIQGLNHSKVLEMMRGDRHLIIGQTRDLYMNTWIGLNGKYVGAGIACPIENQKWFWTDLVKMCRLDVNFSKPDIEYLPRVNYSSLSQEYTERIHSFVEQTQPNRLVMVCNGHVQSNQAENFDFDPAIQLLADEFPNIHFILTTSTNVKNENVHLTSNIINADDRFDLNEISYLSTFTDTIVGRSSGPHIFSSTYENYLDENKAFLSFTYSEAGGHVSGKTLVKAKRYWSGVTDTQGVFKKIRSVIER
ncbi:hypothetical protein LCGC14_1721570 [marine sediment metagenome]|uniref:Polysaccharide pyruvyl transferase domain-containing protein n=1 Tax=marine sediment metagenome TaxID=412755 RepID=A0A0F9KBZ1_9ZZZZ